MTAAEIFLLPRAERRRGPFRPRNWLPGVRAMDNVSFGLRIRLRFGDGGPAPRPAPYRPRMAPLFRHDHWYEYVLPTLWPPRP